MNVCFPKLPVTRTTYSIRFSHLSSLLPWDAETNAQIYKNKHSLFTIAKHFSLVFSVLNKLIILDVHRFWFEYFFLLFLYFFSPFIFSSMRNFMTDNIQCSWILFFLSLFVCSPYFVPLPTSVQIDFEKKFFNKKIKFNFEKID